jgi:hypothetical protein
MWRRKPGKCQRSPTLATAAAHSRRPVGHFPAAQEQPAKNWPLRGGGDTIKNGLYLPKNAEDSMKNQTPTVFLETNIPTPFSSIDLTRNKLGLTHSRFSRVLASLIVIGLGGGLGGDRLHGETWQILVRGGETALNETPVVVKLTVPLPVGLYVMTPVSGGPGLPAQVFDDGTARHLGVILPGVVARQATKFSLLGPASATDARTSGLSFENHGRDLRVKLMQQLLTEYRMDIGNKPFFYPLVGPTGESYTRTYPLTILPDEDHDHPHQRSCWFTYGNVDGIDFWSEGKRFGMIKEISRKLEVAGPVVGRLVTQNEWRAPNDQKMCVDERTVTFYRTQTARIIDFDFRIKATEGPVTFLDTKEGMFGIRVASSMDVTRKLGGKITNAEGLTNEKAWGKPSIWVDYAGPVKDKTVGIAIINHSRSFRYPTTWHVRTYGLFAANPFGWHDFGRPERGDCTIAGNQVIDFSYRVVLHDGDTNSANLPAIAAGYLKPPVIEIQKD